MEDILIKPVALSLAVAAVVLVWLHGSIFAKARAWTEAYGGWLGDLAKCPLCLSMQAAIWLFVIGFLPGYAWSGEWLKALLWVVYVPASGLVGMVIYAHMEVFLRKMN